MWTSTPRRRARTAGRSWPRYLPRPEAPSFDRQTDLSAPRRGQRGLFLVRAHTGDREDPQAGSADSGKTGRLAPSLTTPSSQPVPYTVFTFQHSFITIKTSAGSCAHYTISGAVSCYLPVRHSSPTPKARGSNPPGRTKSSAFWALLFVFYMKLSGMLQGVDSNSLCPPSASRRAKTVLRTVFKARLSESPRPHHGECSYSI